MAAVPCRRIAGQGGVTCDALQPWGCPITMPVAACLPACLGRYSYSVSPRPLLPSRWMLCTLYRVLRSGM